MQVQKIEAERGVLKLAPLKQSTKWCGQHGRCPAAKALQALSRGYARLDNAEREGSGAYRPLGDAEPPLPRRLLCRRRAQPDRDCRIRLEPDAADGCCR